MVKYINKDGKCLAIVSLSTAGKRLPEPIHKNVVLMVCYKRLLTNTASYVSRHIYHERIHHTVLPATHLC